MTTTYAIGTEAAIEVLGGKWKTIILCHLSNGPMRTSALKRAIPTVTQKMLTQQLRDLETAGVVQRHIYSQVPPKVEYSLTEYGDTLRNILTDLRDWGEDNIARRRAQGEEILVLNEGK